MFKGILSFKVLGQRVKELFHMNGKKDGFPFSGLYHLYGYQIDRNVKDSL